MARYWVHKQFEENGEHEVHREGCPRLAEEEGRIGLGDFHSCTTAMRIARQHFRNCNGCFFCCSFCHVSPMQREQQAALVEDETTSVSAEQKRSDDKGVTPEAS